MIIKENYEINYEEVFKNYLNDNIIYFDDDTQQYIYHYNDMGFIKDIPLGSSYNDALNVFCMINW